MLGIEKAINTCIVDFDLRESRLPRLDISSAMFGWSWTKVSVLGSQVFGQALI